MFIGFIGLIGFIGFKGFKGFIGFIGFRGLVFSRGVSEGDPRPSKANGYPGHSKS